MENLIIRDAEVKDAKEIASIHVKTWQHTYKGHMPDSYLESLTIDNRSEKWQKDLESPRPKVDIFVVTIDNKIAGFCGIGQSKDTDANKNTGEIFTMYVDHNLLRKGVGSALIEEAIKRLKTKGFNSATLWVLDSNINARKFYENKGWFIDGKTKIDKIGNFEIKEVRYRIDFD